MEEKTSTETAKGWVDDGTVFVVDKSESISDFPSKIEGWIGDSSSMPPQDEAEFKRRFMKGPAFEFEDEQESKWFNAWEIERFWQMAYCASLTGLRSSMGLKIDHVQVKIHAEIDAMGALKAFLETKKHGIFKCEKPSEE